MLKNKLKGIAKIATLAGTVTLLANCDVKQTQEGEMPEVEVKGGQMPKFDVDAGDIDVETKTVEVEVPVLDFDTPAEDEAEDGTE